MKILLKGGYVIDGSGAPGFKGDVLVDGERIAAVGANLDVQADKTVDCTGLTVAPGFIDAHSHNDFFYDYDDAEKYYEPFVRQGITTQVTGNCGFRLSEWRRTAGSRTKWAAVCSTRRSPALSVNS